MGMLKAALCVVLLVTVVAGHVQRQADDTTCVVSIEDNKDYSGQLDESVEVVIKQQYISVTNFYRYSKSRNTFNVDIHKDGGFESVELIDDALNDHELLLAFNGTHVCASVGYIHESEACADIGCTGNKPKFECRHKCFLVFGNDYGVNELDLYRSAKNVFGVGLVTKRDFVEVAVNIQRRCYGQDIFYYSKVPVGNVPEVRCGANQKCRVTIAYIGKSSNPRYYVGCEDNSNHVDGCTKQGCHTRVYEKIPGSSNRFRWAKVCRFCCVGDLCNNVGQCQGDYCDFY